MKDEAPDKRSVGRPRKRSTEKKTHRVQVAMSDQQKADAERLAELQDTSVSAAVASSVTVALRALEFDRYVDAAVEILKAAAKRTASELADGGLAKYADTPEPSNVHRLVAGDVDASWSTGTSLLMKYGIGTGRMLLLVDFVGSLSSYRELQTPLSDVYDDALRKFTVRIAENYRDTVGMDIARFPYTPEKTVVLFAPVVVGGGTNVLFHYLQPLESGGIYAHLP